MVPEGQQRCMDYYVKPGQFDEDHPELAEGPEAAVEEAPPVAAQGSQATGSGGDGAGGDPWKEWQPARKPAAAANPRFQGLPEGCELIEGTIGFRTPSNDFMFRKGWMPKGEAFAREGRKFLTNHSQHAQTVQAKQLPARATFLEAHGYPDGHDGLTFRQLLEA
eukprot:3236401-Heterocapsa_arctica.AAC.1